MRNRLYANMKRLTTIFCICIAAITVAVLVLRLTLFRDMATVPQTSIQQGGSDRFTYRLNSRVYFSTPNAKGNVLIENPDTNEHLMTVSLLDNATGDSLLYTGFIEPGKSVSSMKLDLTLAEGVYECTALITAYDPQSREPRGDQEEPVTIYIGERPPTETDPD